MTEDQKRYKVEKITSSPYLNESGEVIEGFTIRVRLFEFDELVDFKLANVSPDNVKEAIESHLKDREDIRDLG